MFLFRKSKSAVRREILEKLQAELQQQKITLVNEEDSYTARALHYAAELSTLNSNRNNVANRIDYLKGLKERLIVSLTPALSINEFKDLCTQCVNTITDLEAAETELHALEVTFERNFESYDERMIQSRFHLDDLRNNIDVTENKIDDFLSKKI